MNFILYIYLIIYVLAFILFLQHTFCYISNVYERDILCPEFIYIYLKCCKYMLILLNKKFQNYEFKLILLKFKLVLCIL